MKKCIKDLYDLLGVPETATKEEIKSAFYSKAKTAHPDQGGDAEEFKKISFAYEVLMDDEKRANYELSGNMDESLEDRAIQCIIQSYIGFCKKINFDQLLYTNITNSIQFELDANIQKIHDFNKDSRKFLKGITKKEKQCEIKNKKLDLIFMIQKNEIIQRRQLVVKELRMFKLALKLLKEGIVEKELKQKPNYGQYTVYFG